MLTAVHIQLLEYLPTSSYEIGYETIMKLSRWGMLAGLLLLAAVFFGFPIISADKQFQQARKDADLVKAVKQHDTAQTTQLLHQGANPNSLASSESPSTLLEFIRHRLFNQPVKQRLGVPILLMLLQEPQEHSDLVRVILDAGANPNVFTSHGKSALFFTYLHHHWPSMQALLQRGANPNRAWYPDTPDFFPLAWTAVDNDVRATTLLLENGANINITDAHGYTPLMIAADAGHEAIVKVLLSRGAFLNCTSTSAYRYTALKLAHEKRYQRITHLLIQAGEKY